MRIEIVSDVLISGEPQPVGSRLEVAPEIARLLINANQAAAVVGGSEDVEKAPAKRARKGTHSHSPEGES